MGEPKEHENHMGERMRLEREAKEKTEKEAPEKAEKPQRETKTDKPGRPETGLGYDAQLTKSEKAIKEYVNPPTPTPEPSPDKKNSYEDRKERGNARK